MPYYSYRCPTCSLEFDSVVPVALRKTIRCARCRIFAEIVIKKAPMVHAPGEFVPFESPGTGKLITSKSRLVDDLKASGCHLREPGEEKDTARRRQEIEKAEDQAIENAVVETARGLGL